LWWSSISSFLQPPATSYAQTRMCGTIPPITNTSSWRGA
jgi:hypothetical protein